MDVIGNHSDALKALENAFTINPANKYVAFRLSKQFRKSDLNKSIAIIEKAIEKLPDDKDLHFHLAKLHMGNAFIVSESILYHLRKSFIPRDNRFEAQFWFARALLLLGHDAEAKQIFFTLATSKVNYDDKVKRRGAVMDSSATPREYTGKVVNICYNYAFIEVNGIGIEAFAHEKDFNDDGFVELRAWTKVKFYLAFTFKGPIAFNISF